MNKFEKINNVYFLILFSILPISIIVGPAVSLTNISLIALSFIVFYLYKNSLNILKSKVIIFLLIIYIYLIFNNFISLDTDIGTTRNFGFIRYIFLFLAINLIFSKLDNFENIFKIWFLIISIVIFDVFYEFFIGSNLLGFESPNKKRIVSFFKDEAVVGAFLNGFIFIILGFLFSNYEKKNFIYKIFVFSFLVLIISCLIFTGERSNTLKLFFGLTIFFYFNDKIKLNYKIFFLFSVIFVFFLTILNSTEIKHRYSNDLIQKLKNKESRERYIYFKLYNSAYEVFKKYPILGVGNKNYRIEACRNIENKNKNYVCNTHPHQIYFEFLSEHGLFGSLIILTIIFYLIFRNFKTMIRRKNLIQIGCFSYLMTVFIPFLPGGSFFADFNSNFFWLNFSLYYASNYETNIFK